MEDNLRELAERTADGVHVRLLWDRVGQAVLLEVADGRTGERYEVHVPDDRALDAFDHPFVYISSPGARMVASDAAGPSGAKARLRRAA